MPRMVKRLTKDFTVVNNAILKNKNLSIAERGLLITLISLPDDWSFSVNGLTKILPDGRDKIDRAVNSLIAAGYIVKKDQERNSGKYGNGVWIVSDDPASLERERTLSIATDQPYARNPSTDKPTPENPSSVFPTQYNNTIQSRKQSIKKTSSSDEDLFNRILFNIEYENIQYVSKPESDGKRRLVIDCIYDAIRDVIIGGHNIGTKERPISNVDAVKVYQELRRDHIEDLIKRIEPDVDSIGDLLSYIEVALYREPQEKPHRKDSFNHKSERHYTKDEYDEMMKSALKSDRHLTY